MPKTSAILRLPPDDPRFCFAMDIAVRDYELDSEGIVNNAIYLHYLEHTRHTFCQQAGVSFRQMREAGYMPVANHLEVDYLQPLRSGNVVRSALFVEARGPRFIFHQHLFLPDGTPVLRAVVSIVTLNADGTLSRGDELKRHFAAYLYHDGNRP